MTTSMSRRASSRAESPVNSDVRDDLIDPAPDTKPGKRVSFTRSPSPDNELEIGIQLKTPRSASPESTFLPSLSLSLASLSMVDTELAALDTEPETARSSTFKYPYADLNRDEDTFAPFASSAPRSETASSARSTSDARSSMSTETNGSSASELGEEGLTRGSDALSEPDTQQTARAARYQHRRISA
jgi:hypothetical protein